MSVVGVSRAQTNADVVGDSVPKMDSHHCPFLRKSFQLATKTIPGLLTKDSWPCFKILMANDYKSYCKYIRNMAWIIGNEVTRTISHQILSKAFLIALPM